MLNATHFSAFIIDMGFTGFAFSANKTTYIDAQGVNAWLLN